MPYLWRNMGVWNVLHLLNQKPEVKEAKRLYHRRPEVKEKERVYAQRFEQKPEVKERRRIQRELKRMNPKIGRCPSCRLEERIFRKGLCRRCYNIRRLGGIENLRRVTREYSRKQREKPKFKIWQKAFKPQRRRYNRKRNFFIRGKPVGAFDPNRIMADRL